MRIKDYDEFIDDVHASHDGNLAKAMRAEIRALLAEFGQEYDLDADPQKQLLICSESIMNLVLETKYEW